MRCAIIFGGGSAWYSVFSSCYLAASFALCYSKTPTCVFRFGIITLTGLSSVLVQKHLFIWRWIGAITNLTASKLALKFPYLDGSRHCRFKVLLFTTKQYDPTSVTLSSLSWDIAVVYFCCSLQVKQKTNPGPIQWCALI